MLENPIQEPSPEKEGPRAGKLALHGLEQAYRNRQYRLKEVREKISEVAVKKEDERPPMNALLFAERTLVEEMDNIEREIESLGGDIDEARNTQR